MMRLYVFSKEHSKGQRRLLATASRSEDGEVSVHVNEPRYRPILESLLLSDFESTVGFPAVPVHFRQGSREAFEATAAYLVSSLGLGIALQHIGVSAASGASRIGQIESVRNAIMALPLLQTPLRERAAAVVENWKAQVNQMERLAHRYGYAGSFIKRMAVAQRGSRPIRKNAAPGVVRGSAGNITPSPASSIGRSISAGQGSLPAAAVIAQSRHHSMSQARHAA